MMYRKNDQEQQGLLTVKVDDENQEVQPKPLLNAVVVPDEVWRCSVCIVFYCCSFVGQYLNRGENDRCPMCNSLRGQESVSTPIERTAEERAEPIVKKSKIGVGMKLSRSEVSFMYHQLSIEKRNAKDFY